MPNIKSAKKKLRKDVKRAKLNEIRKKAFKKTVGKEKDVKKVFSTIDKAAKKGIIHKNKAARMKSRISRSATKK